MASQHSTNTDFISRYKFNAKELDKETGWYYYGARYYNPSTSTWLSVDPLAEKYQSFSPYNYTLNNPVNLVDADGRSVETDYIWTDKNGKEQSVHVNDGINQVVRISKGMSFLALGLAKSGISNPVDNALNQGLMETGVLQPNLFYTIKNVLANKPYVGYIEHNCNISARKQNNRTPMGSDESLQMLWKNDKGLSAPDFKLGIEYLKKSLSNGNSIMVGVYEKNGDVGNYNKLTGHFINVVGMGYDVTNGKNYFLYYDNAVSNPTLGINLAQNRLYYFNTKNNLSIFGDKTPPNRGNYTPPYYYMTEVRPNY